MTEHNRRGKTSLRLIRSLRGAGTLTWSEGQVPVTYQLDLFEGRDRRTGSGSMDGDLGPLAEAGADSGRLRLADGFELDVALVQIDEDGAMFEARSDLPAD